MTRAPDDASETKMFSVEFPSNVDKLNLIRCKMAHF